MYNTFTKKDYIFAVNNVKKKNINMLGLYRSILENEKLNNDEKIEVRNILNEKHFKTFEFYQIKDPDLYMKLFLLDKDYNEQQKEQLFEDVELFQEKKLKEKRFGHRNFGTYSKHNCGMKDCPMNGLMVRQGSAMAERCLNFKSDTNKSYKKTKSKNYKKERKNSKNLVERSLSLN